ncbi:MAG: DUF4364 domain-containing protein [Clostridiales bacterium]|uniref:Uncharacterized protein DUF4364 n=1 Tax=Harryflintia acetispora TaxID=1849041 RepID=A0A9X8UJA6_9FIRM|nr:MULTISPECIES: DUF4364 family protein [Oscillospiraceae]PWM36249.1 MAG: DUF4364 domain-containing protein [Clostridiales bacterium]RGB67902.1 DUF4364 family protein [Harryflintia acetispora]TCL43425.1 uncharacterized protein DUF4364 [Harryflintia acetispora]
MQGNIFTAGVAPGAPTNDFEIKFLICHLLEQAGEPVTFGQLATTFQKTGYVNYFEFSSLMSEMLEQGHLRMLGEGGMAYELTEHGRSTAKQFYKDVPLAVRERCERELQRQLTLGRRMRENSVVIRPEGDGYVITLEIPDIGASLMKLSLFVPTKELCEQVKRRFLNDPQLTYKGVIALVTGDLGTVGSLIPSGEELFD